ncbi:uncharacterized protein LOC131041249 isoform X1 [Cryptomeria japonica]|uniref:uncharacterized protein LOC131041249 isoform X1 n=1 Tax=Cryptomeria japonica TaxID=3369 RepID=UPI0027D9D8F6|nr:uncharacterized protein LOC131041249 isoform X1 [Cryptomeria japonica]XP_059063473.1 uncharacterized protein LOC131041249 isoform X1 [Cryptomeria japonica]
MDAIVAAALNEISARGEQGCLLQHLWSGLQIAAASAGLHLCDGVKQMIWQALLKVPGLSFGAPGSSMDRIFPNSHPSIQSVESAERLGLNIVAPEHLRDSCVGLYDLKFSDAGLSADQRFALERLATARTQGVTQNQLAKEFGIKGNKLFYIVRSLESRGLLVRQSTLVRTKGGGSEAENGFKGNSIVNTNLIHLSRYAKHLNLSSQQRFEIRKSSASEFIEDRNMPSGMEGIGQGGREDLLIKDDLPAMKSVCDKLEESDGKVLVVSDLKVSLGYRMTVGHRAWRRISKRLIAAGLVELFQARIDKKVVQCIRLLKSFDAKAFHPKLANSGNDDCELESIRKAKRGQATEQLVEIPIDHQIYDLIESEGSKGLTVTEMWKRLGLNYKRNYYRLTNMVSRFGLHLQAESHKRSMHYRVWTSNNLNSYENDCPANSKQNVSEEAHGSELALVDGEERLISGSYNPISETHFNSTRKSHKQEEAVSQCGRLKIKIKQRKSELQKGGCNLSDNCQALVCAETTIKQLDPDGHMYGGEENIFPKTSRTQNLQFDEKVHMAQPINSTTPMLRAGQRYPCLTVTTVSAQREQRILERLHVEKFILRVELYRWLEDLEKGKSTTMDRKTLTRALQRLQNEGHCKSILVSVPVVTNCGRSRTTEVVLHPSVEVGPELMGQIHEKLRNFEMQSRGQGLARSKNDDSVPILSGIKRTSHSEPSDFQSVRAESMRANGFIPAKMVRIKLLHQYLWSYVSSLPDWDAALSSGKHGYDVKNPNSTCKLFSLDGAIKAMPLELFMQVIGSVKKIGDLAENCRLGLCLCDLPEEEFKSLMDTHATGRLSWLIDVIRRLKLLRLVMVKGHEEDDGDAVPQAVLTYAMELKPYIEEPVPRAVPSLTANVFDLRPRVRHDFVLSSRDALDAYWKTLEYCFCAADPTIAARAFPGSSVPEIFLQRSWTSVRVMTVDQRTELLKRVANDDLEKRMSFKECVKISKDLNLTLEQVLRVSYEKNRKARLVALQREAMNPSDLDDKMQIRIKTQRHSPKRKRSSLEEFSEYENLDIQFKRPSLQRESHPYEGTDKKGDLYDGTHVDEGHNEHKKELCEGNDGGGEDQDDLDDEDANDDIFINHISSLSRLKPTRKRRFPWTDSLERSLITSYARYRTPLGARFHRVDWVSVPGLPAPPETCRRRIASFKHEPTVRKALMHLCNLLTARYSKHLQQMDGDLIVDDADIGNLEGPSQLYPLWDDFEEPSIAAAVDEVMRCKCMAKLSAVKKNGVSSTFVANWSESTPSDKFTSNDSVNNGSGPAYVSEYPYSSSEHASKVSSSSTCALADFGVPTSASSMSCVVVSGSADTNPSGRINIGGGRTRTNRRRLPKKVQKLLENEDFSTEKLVHKSVAVANAVELIKLVFLNSSTNTEVPQVLVNTLRQYSEFDVFAAFNFLRAHGLVVVGHGVQPFVLSPKFFHNASASPFPIGTGEKASKFAKWLTRVQKELEEDWISLPSELNCGDLFHLFGLVSSGDILIAPNLPNEGIGDADDPRGLKRKIDKEKVNRDPQSAKRKLPWPREGELCTRRERGFPGIQVNVHRATIPMAEIFTRDVNDKNQLEDDAVGCSGQSDLDADLSSVTVNRDLFPNYNCDHLEGPNTQSIESHKHLLEALVSFAEEIFSLRTMQEEPSFFQPQWFESALDAIEKAGDEGLSLEQVAHSIGLDEHHMVQTDAIVEALQSFNQVIKVNAFDHVRAFTHPHGSKYSLLVFPENHEDTKTADARHHKAVTGILKTTQDIQKMYTQENEGFCRPSIIPSISLGRHKDRSVTVGDGHLVTILEMPEMDKTDPAICKQCDPLGVVSTGNTEKNEEQLETVSNCPAVQNFNLEQETTQSEQDLPVNAQSQFLPILPWLGADGETNTVMLKALTRRALGIVMQHPGILEDDLIKQLDILNPQSARKLLQLLELDNHLHLREMCESKRTPPNILKSLIGPNFKKRKQVWRKHYYANPMSTAIL